MTARLPITDDEARRLEALHDLLVLDTEAEPLFDTLVRTAAESCGMPIALVTLVDAQRQWFKANHGVAGFTETPRDISFCTHTIESPCKLEIADLLLDARFEHNPVVVGGPKLRFYAGVPLVLAGGQRVGTLCVADREPRRLDAAQSRLLHSLASMATQALELRRDLIKKTLQARSSYETALARSEAIHRSLVQHQSELVSLSDEQGLLSYVNDAYAAHFNRPIDTLIGSDLYQGVDALHIDDVRAQMARVFATGEPLQRDFLTLDAQGQARWVAWTHSLQRFGNETPMLYSVGRDVTDRRALEQVLADKERFVRLITDNLPMQVAYMDTERRYRFANEPHCVRMGLAREQILGRTRAELMDGPGEGDIERYVDQALQGLAQDVHYEADVRGSRLSMQLRLAPDCDEHGRVRGVFCAAVDITARETSERSVRELLAIFENTTDFVTQSSATGLLQYMNPAARQLAGMGPLDPLDNVPYAAFNTSFSRERFYGEMMPDIERRGVWLGRSVVRGIPVSHMVIGHRDMHGKIARLSTLMRDISDEARAQEEQLRQATILRSIAEAIPAAVAVVGPDQRYRFVNQVFAAQVSMDDDPVEGRTMREVLGDPLYETDRRWVDKALAGETVTFEKEPAERNPGQHLAITYIPLRLDSHTLDGFVTVVQDVTRQKHEENRLKHLSQRDALTGLMNRAGLEMYLQQALYDPDQNQAQLGLLYIDLDRFKPVNDTHGHPTGDELLKQFASRLSKLVRPTDAVVRHGGDEFAVVLPNVRDIAGLANVADKVIAMAASPFQIGHHHLSIGASVGFALGIDEGGGWPGLMKRADMMLYKAKAAGRGRGFGDLC